MDYELMKILKFSTLLLVENDEIENNIDTNFFSMYVNEIYKVNSFEKGLELFYKVKPNFIITDISINGELAFEFIEDIRDENYSIPILVTSDVTTKEYLLKIINLQANDYLIKPINEEVLLTSIRRVAHILDSNAERFNVKITEGVYYKPCHKSICVDDVCCNLTLNEAIVLELLIINRGNAVTNAMVEEKLYIFKEMSEVSFKNIIYKLRRKITKDCIVTTKNGYSLNQISN